MSGLNLPAVTKRSIDIFASHPWTMIAIGLPAAIFHTTFRLWWSPSLDLLATFLSIGVSEIVAAALIYAAGRAYEGDRPTFVDSYREVLRRMGALLELLIRYWGAVTLLALTIVGIPFAIRILVRWFFGTQALILNNATPKQAISHSCQVVKGLWWQIAGTLLLVVSVFASPWIVAWVLWGSSSPGAVVVTGIHSVVLGPALVIFWTLLFLHIRDRDDLATTTERGFQPA